MLKRWVEDVFLESVQRRKWSPTANDPQTGNDPQMIPNPKWFPMCTANVPAGTWHGIFIRVVASVFNIVYWYTEIPWWTVLGIITVKALRNALQSAFVYTYSHCIWKQFNRSKTCERIKNVSLFTKIAWIRVLFSGLHVWLNLGC